MRRNERRKIIAAARSAGLAPSTVWNRCERNGMTAEQAASYPPMTPAERARRASAKSPWRNWEP